MAWRTIRTAQMLRLRNMLVIQFILIEVHFFIIIVYTLQHTMLYSTGKNVSNFRMCCISAHSLFSLCLNRIGVRNRAAAVLLLLHHIDFALDAGAAAQTLKPVVREPAVTVVRKACLDPSLLFL